MKNYCVVFAIIFTGCAIGSRDEGDILMPCPYRGEDGGIVMTSSSLITPEEKQKMKDDVMNLGKPVFQRGTSAIPEISYPEPVGGLHNTHPCIDGFGRIYKRD